MIAEIISGIIATIFLLIVGSYYILLFIPKKKPEGKTEFSSITFLVPAHNEGRYIEDCIASIKAATFPGSKQIIIIDDGSEDDTYTKAKKTGATVLKQKHSGKSHSLNRGLKKAKGELIAVVDADSVIEKDAISKSIAYLAEEDVGIVCSTVKVKNRKSFIGMWLHIEQLYNSLLRSLFTKVNVNIVAPGPLSIYRKSLLEEIGGFETKGYSEDVDVAVRTLKAGYRIEHAEFAVSETNMPITVKGFLRQRIRFARGWTNILRRHLRLDHTFWQIYTLPLALFWYFQAVIMGVITIYNIGTGYVQYFLSQGIVFSLAAAKFFFEWLTIAGVIRWAWSILSGAAPYTVFDIISLAATALTYPLYIYAVMRYERKLTLWHAVPIFFLFPFWLVIMIIYIASIPEYFNKNQKNIWVKQG